MVSSDVGNNNETQQWYLIKMAEGQTTMELIL